ncbi:MAG: RsmE family RNA methyltransferase, partial [Anaerolineaceae bacterium]
QNAYRAWLNEQSANQSAGTARVGLFIGPEGGYSDEEAGQARQAGVQPVSMGKRILRMETAAVVAAALALYSFGEMDQAISSQYS